MTKILVTALGFTVLLIVGAISFQDQSKIAQLEKSKDRGKLTWYAEMAKARGTREIGIPPSLVRYAVPRSLAEALDSHNVVVAEALESSSFSANENINTCYKFRIVEELWTPIHSCKNCSTLSDVPPKMLPLQKGEFLALQIGGEVVIDGIRLVKRDPKYPGFEIGKRYLLFVSLDEQKTVGALRMGPWGVFRVKPNETLESVDEALKHPIKTEITHGFGDSLGPFKLHLKKNAKT